MQAINGGEFVNISPSVFFQQAAQKNEYIGLVTLSKDEIFSQCYKLPQAAKQYFVNLPVLNRSEYSENISSLEKELSEVKHDIRKYEKSINKLINVIAEYTGPHGRQFLKYMGATGEYLSAGGFYDIQTGHWDPEINKWHIAPGEQRNIIYILFGPEQEQFMMFNSTGKEVRWDKKLHSVDDIAEAFNSRRQFTIFKNKSIADSILPGVNTYFRNKFNTTVPFITTFSLARTPLETIKKYHQFFATTRININADLATLNYSDSVVADHQQTVNIVVDDPTEINICKGLLIAANFRNYTGHGVTITTSIV